MLRIFSKLKYGTGLRNATKIVAFHSMRAFSSTSSLFQEKVKVNFVQRDGSIKTVEAEVGKSILEVAHENEIDLEGACEASLACSTCHVYVDEPYFDKLPQPEEAEEDMLDLAFGLRENSRLGCQIKLTKELDGITVTLPMASRNIQLDPSGGH